MNIALLANPTAGKGRRAALLPAIKERLGAHVTVLGADSAAAARELAGRAVADGCDALVAMGGDGTVHLGLQAVAGTGTAFGIVPAGTGNDFAVRLGLPTEPLAAADAVAGALAAGATRDVDLARVRGEDGTSAWFGAVLAAGFDAFVNERANRMRWPKGAQRYNRAIVEELVALKPRQYTMRLDGAESRFASVLVAVGNTESYGGGFRIAAGADPTDGLLDVVVAEPLGRLALMGLRPKALKGTHIHDPRVSTYRAKVVELDAAGVTAYADGERICPLPVTIACVPGALKLLQQ
ncbi:diacylglycerol kinase [Dactylosporangium matsuzakiense]|uniref:Diacylglycerol kinase n=1 Tax=Dactylosporangium matsuzakiense TaxID=53360 RepID=A0A9W6KFG1_9ACTN|nr:diacylglycerol kinase [Dactylosporangium matsuzakiense]UWZ42118.1 diacylglycerol kinase [Dactylosporangium matsuzakiense]GLK99748.1 diacylglycerol kinase [Dactylosporangium matsuzakiense]